eukprot:TRINITY_DN9501_c0_g1_i1.p1 TRINITY_DN9501_c0_g1~~TRINITY_DN9501_c0_g1_i1.p1  ORF type:complete len:136 (-),score=23.47 TRINITY_DN9501_c0_g1_i1:331-687(-)
MELVYPYYRVGWCFRPACWNEVTQRWEYAPTSNGEHKFNKKKLKIMSYNVWFDDRQVVKRMDEAVVSTQSTGRKFYVGLDGTSLPLLSCWLVLSTRLLERGDAKMGICAHEQWRTQIQ